MIEILTELHEKYLPLLKTTDDSGNEQVEILQRLFFGGDQLTEERACNARQGHQVSVWRNKIKPGLLGAGNVRFHWSGPPVTSLQNSLVSKVTIREKKKKF